MTGNRELMRLHVEALFTLDDANRLVAVNEPDGAPAPRFFLGRTPDGDDWWFRYDVDETLASDLAALCGGLEASADPTDATPFAARLERAAPVRRTWAGPAFRCPPDLRADALAVRVTLDNATVLAPYMEDWLPDVAARTPLAAVLEDGRAVSLCASVRATPHAHEAGVETHRDFRSRGYGARAVAAWAELVRNMDRIPLYSTSWENEASRALARRLGLIRFGVDLHIT